MWNREDARPAPPVQHHPAPRPSVPELRPTEAKEPRVATLGSSILINGTLTGSEDLTVDGRLRRRLLGGVGAGGEEPAQQQHRQQDAPSRPNHILHMSHTSNKSNPQEAAAGSIGRTVGRA